MHMLARSTWLTIKEKMPTMMPVVMSGMANFLFWGGSFIPLNPAEAESFVYFNATAMLLGFLLAVGGTLMAMVIGFRQFSITAFSAIAANSIVIMAVGLLIWGAVFKVA